MNDNMISEFTPPQPEFTTLNEKEKKRSESLDNHKKKKNKKLLKMFMTISAVAAVSIRVQPEPSGEWIDIDTSGLLPICQEISQELEDDNYEAARQTIEENEAVLSDYMTNYSEYYFYYDGRECHASATFLEKDGLLFLGEVHENISITCKFAYVDFDDKWSAGVVKDIWKEYFVPNPSENNSIMGWGYEYVNWENGQETGNVIIKTHLDNYDSNSAQKDWTTVGKINTEGTFVGTVKYTDYNNESVEIHLDENGLLIFDDAVIDARDVSVDDADCGEKIHDLEDSGKPYVVYKEDYATSDDYEGMLFYNLCIPTNNVYSSDIPIESTMCFSTLYEGKKNSIP